jgi:hypothetical protein
VIGHINVLVGLNLLRRRRHTESYVHKTVEKVQQLSNVICLSLQNSLSSIIDTGICYQSLGVLL